MFLRHAISIFVATGMLAAAEVTPKLTPPALGKLSQDQFQKMLFRALDAPSPKMALALGQLPNQQQKCAIPLLEHRVDNPGNDKMSHAPIVGGVIDRIAVAPSVPACPHWNDAR